MSMNNKEFLQWIHDRLQFVHGDKEGYDYMHKLRSIIASTESDNITQAASNKAAEEGGLPVLDGCKFCLGAKGGIPGNANVLGGEIICDYCTALLMKVKEAEKSNPTSSVFSADRASRQVANKAEVDLSSIQSWAAEGLFDGAKFVLLSDVEALLATPPATTGASTADLESILDRLDDAIGGYSGGPFDKVLAIIDELRSAPDCGACPGNGSMCKSRCKVEEESPASTVLTDERIEKMWDAAFGSMDIPPAAYTFAREVAAQAGQVAVPENVRNAALDEAADLTEGCNKRATPYAIAVAIRQLKRKSK